MEIRNIGERNTIFNQFISELRSKDIQGDRIRFRRNLERVGEIFAYEISKELEYESREITTPLDTLEMMLPKYQPVLATILRAGLPLHNGLLNYFDQAGNAYVSAYRKYSDNGGFDIHMEYASSPDITGKTLILSDPMLATGASMALTYKELLNVGKPKHTHIVVIIASEQGIETIVKELPENDVTLWVGTIDKILTSKAYISPGLGDAGDLAFGTKM
ncbi:MAG: uracil phosphoribosyltransferase [Bacteroidota bacterium]|nr:uracil phosphoribosyltransferase [Bacteroidota bacterium]